MNVNLIHFISSHQKLAIHISESDMFHVLLKILSEHISADLLASSKKMPFSKDMDTILLESLTARNLQNAAGKPFGMLRHSYFSLL